jgi:outer membrane immunogenic protein
MKRFLFPVVAVLALGGNVIAAERAVKAPATARSHNWTGFYAGVNAGYGWGNGDTSFDPLPSAVAFANLAPTTLRPNPGGLIGGLQVGYNLQSGRLVWGIETDFQFSGITGSVIQTPIIRNNGTPVAGASYLSASEKTDWFGTLRLRAGVTPIDRVLLYVTGGLAYGHVSYTGTTDYSPAGSLVFPASVSTTKVGWAIGGGTEWVLSANWTAKAEYLYYDLGRKSATADAIPVTPPYQVTYDWKTTAQIARVGVNYKF